MALAPGSRLGAYEIVSLLGAGGMGEVYRARDTRLKRDVAVKILPDAFTSDPDRVARFQREAELLATLNHPNIAGIYGLEQADGMRALVLELVEGPTLADRISKGPVPIDEALLIAGQIADALEAAHERGVIHRDLKPANIKVRADGTVKVLDFGLAKAMEPAGAMSVSASMSPTMASPAMTQAGMILGTAAYMSPEQARGRSVDKRADVWAFGCVLHEMLTGTPLFAGDSVPETLGLIFSREPDLVTLPAATPARVRTLIARCLVKDPRQRLRDIGEARLALDALSSIALVSDAGPPGSVLASRPTRGIPWPLAAAVAVLSAVVAGGVVWSVARRPPESAVRAPIRFALSLGQDVSFATDFPVAALSPDGGEVVFVSQDVDGIGRLSRRRLDQPESMRLPGTEGAFAPFFSPDGLWVGFFAGGKLKKIRLEGSGPVVLCDAPAGRGASWGDDGRIIAALDNRSGLSLITAEGGAVTRVTDLGPGEITHRVPQMLPGGKAVLFLVNTSPGSYAAGSLAVASLDASPVKPKIILPNVGLSPRYLPTGHISYVSNGTLYAVPFDLNRLEVHGTATPILEDVSASVAFGFAHIDFSRNGHVLYRIGRTSGRRIVQWLLPDGRVQPLWGEPGFYQFPILSPDGTRLAVVVTDGAATDIWVYDLQRGTKTRLSSAKGVSSYPIWSVDGRYVLFQLGGQMNWVSADGAERPQPLLTTAGSGFPSSFTPDGRTLMYFELKPGGGSLIKTVPITTQSGQLKVGDPRLFRELTAGNPAPAISPDGRWVAYASSESGVYEVYVRAFPDTGRQWPVSTGGGSLPVWSRTRNELTYRTEDQILMVASYAVSGDTFIAAKPRAWSDTRLFNTGFVQNFTLAPDGTRFAVLMSAERPDPRLTQHQAMLVLNFLDDVQRRMAAGRN